MLTINEPGLEWKEARQSVSSGYFHYSKIHCSHQVTPREEILFRRMTDSEMGHEQKSIDA